MVAADGREYISVMVERGETPAARRARLIDKRAGSPTMMFANRIGSSTSYSIWQPEPHRPVAHGNFTLSVFKVATLPHGGLPGEPAFAFEAIP